MEGKSQDGSHGSFGSNMRATFMKGKGQMKHIADLIHIQNRNEVPQDGLTPSGRRVSRRASLTGGGIPDVR